MSIEIVEFCLPDWMGPYLINDDPSGLDDEDIKEIDKFLKCGMVFYNNTLRFVSMNEDSSFKAYNDFNHLGQLCSTFIAHLIPNAF